MRRTLAIAVVSLLGALAGPAVAGPIRLGVETDAPVAEPFLVRVTGHYASIHNGTSRHWKDALIPAGGRHFVALGPVNVLLNMGVSVSIYHPAFVAARARSHQTPLLFRPVGFDTFRPRRWRALLTSGGEFTNGGPEQFLGQALGHVQTFAESYLPALDASDAWTPSDAALRAYLPLFREIEDFAGRDEATRRRTHWGERQRDSPDFARALARQDLESRTELREWVRRSEAWLSVPREQRRVVRRRMAQMRYAKTLAEQLLTARDYAELGAFVDRTAEDRAAGREPEGSASWTNPETHVSYRISLRETPRACASLNVTSDLTTLVDVDLGDMTKTVAAKFCRRESGSWGYGPS